MRVGYFHFGLVFMSLWLGGCDHSMLVPLGEDDPPVTTPRTIILRVTDICPETGEQFKDFFIRQRSYLLREGVPRIDSDWDGVPNESDNSSPLNIVYSAPDTNQDGIEDLVVFAAGIPQRAQLAFPDCSLKGIDTDSDAISDCGERLLGTDPLNPDEDGDGIPDGVELMLGLDYHNIGDGWIDSDGDGFSNLMEVKMNTPPSEVNDARTQAYAFSYELLPNLETESGCVTATVSNVAIVDLVNGDSIDLYFTFERYDEENSDQKRQLKSAKIYIPNTQPGGSIVTYAYDDLILR